MILRTLLFLTAMVVWAAEGPVRLFNGKNLDGFDTFLQSQGVNNDPEKVFQVHDGMVYISGREYGYIIIFRGAIVHWPRRPERLGATPPLGWPPGRLPSRGDEKCRRPPPLRARKSKGG